MSHAFQRYHLDVCTHCGRCEKEHPSSEAGNQALPRVIWQGAGLRVVEVKTPSPRSLNSRVALVSGRGFTLEAVGSRDALGGDVWAYREFVASDDAIRAILGLVEGERSGELDAS